MKTPNDEDRTAAPPKDDDAAPKPTPAPTAAEIYRASIKRSSDWE